MKKPKLFGHFYCSDINDLIRLPVRTGNNYCKYYNDFNSVHYHHPDSSGADSYGDFYGNIYGYRYTDICIYDNHYFIMIVNYCLTG